MKALILASLFLAAAAPDSCVPQPPPEKWVPLADPVPLETGGHRISVTYLGKFYDKLAYEDVRGIYIIRDSETGKEFVGISGIGISELGSHASGDDTIKDER